MSKYLITNKQFVKIKYRIRMGKKLNLKNPVTFNEKIQWLKLNWHDPFAEECADKYEVRKIVKEKIGEQYLNSVVRIYDKVDDIRLNDLPNSFIFKGTHGSGFNTLCKNKNDMNWKKQYKVMKRWVRNNYFLRNREWVYKNIKPRIICESFLEDNNQSEGLTDYKFYCFNGVPKYCQVIKDRDNGGTIDFFDTNWHHMEFNGLQFMPQSKISITKPEKLEEMLNIAKILSSSFPFVRVDLYYVNNRVYFGELTFFPRSGYGGFQPQEWNKKIGNLIELPDKKIE